MKLKIKVKRFDKTIELPKFIKKGEWVDLRTKDDIEFLPPSAETLKRNGDAKYREVNFDWCYIPLGVAMRLPEGFEAILSPRSSTFNKYGIIQPNSPGVIDNSYSSDRDEWMMPAISFRYTIIPKGDRICQFRIQLSQKATMWQKIKWLFSSGVEIVEVDSLGDSVRGGFGSTGVK